jgi:hypothetical protein
LEIPQLKFTPIFILFNTILVIFMLLIFITPVLVLGADFAHAFWRTGWSLVVLLGAVLIALNVFYFDNRRLFALLEREDWPALAQYLEVKVIRKGRYSSHLVRLLANTYLLLSDSAAVISLENKVAIAKPALIEEHALVFGAARILSKDYAGAAEFFGARRLSRKDPLRDWIRWYRGFALLLDRQFSAASEEFSALARFSSDGVLTGLSAYLLEDTLHRILPDREAGLAAEEGRKRVLAALPDLAAWNREASKIQTEVYAAIISKHVVSTAKWIYASPVSA